jgi:putative ABC transport system substrate-binding protein
LVEVPSVAELETAFTALLRDRPDALLVVTDPLVFTHRARITEFAGQSRLPAIYEFRTFVEVGGLMSYGPNMLELWRRAAYYVDRILKGARPADLPVEQPTKIELVVNLRTATALGLTMPPSVMARADEVIQ